MIEKIVADLHTHTNVSQHAYSSAYENIMAASRKGLLALAITDHGPKLSDGAREIHFRNLGAIPEKVGEVRILRGIEANIMDFEGRIDLSEEMIINRLDLCIASFHREIIAGGTLEEQTQAYLNLADQKCVDIIGHSGNVAYPYDYEKVIQKFKENDKVVEINEASFKVREASIKNCLAIAKLCKKYEVSIVVDTDAHFCEYIGEVPNSLEMLNEIEFPESLVINASKENLEKWLQKKGKRL